MSDAGIYPPLSISTSKAPEPMAFLTMEMEFARASSTFADAIGRSSVKGLNLAELVAPGDRDRALGCRREIQEEQLQKDPHYLPPIFGRQEADRVIQSLGFSHDELSRYALDRQEFLGFVGQDGQTRHFSVRMGLAKQESIYFVVMALQIAVRSFQHPTPSPKPREMYSYHPMQQQQQQQQQQQYSQLTPVSATFEPRQYRLGEPSYGMREAPNPGPPPPPPPPPQMMAGMSSSLPPYSVSPPRAEYSGSSAYQVPRSELLPLGRGSKPPGVQLPPIRSQQGGPPPPPPPPQQHQHQQRQDSSSHSARDDRYRMGIGGLLDRPDPSKKWQS